MHKIVVMVKVVVIVVHELAVLMDGCVTVETAWSMSAQVSSEP